MVRNIGAGIDRRRAELKNCLPGRRAGCQAEAPSTMLSDLRHDDMTGPTATSAMLISILGTNDNVGRLRRFEEHGGALQALTFFCFEYIDTIFT